MKKYGQDVTITALKFLTMDITMKTIAFLASAMILTSHYAFSESIDLNSKNESTVHNYTIVNKPQMIVVGIECRTSNDSDRAPIDIPKHWNKFFNEDVASRVPNKLSNDVIAVYCDYEGDYTQPYTLVLGYAVSSSDEVPEGMVFKSIPDGSYAHYRAIGEQPKTTVDTWVSIWLNNELPRAYNADYEFYGEKYFSGNPQEVEIFIGIEDAVK